MDALLPSENPFFHFRDQSWFTCINALSVSLEKQIALKDVGQTISLAQHFSQCLLQSAVWQKQCHSKCLTDTFIEKALRKGKVLIQSREFVKYSLHNKRAGTEMIERREHSHLWDQRNITGVFSVDQSSHYATCLRVTVNDVSTQPKNTGQV